MMKIGASRYRISRDRALRQEGGIWRFDLDEYHTIKAMSQGLLFYRMGNFYDLCFDDAEIASDVLGFALMTRIVGTSYIPTCCVPVERFEDCIHRLIEKGYEVTECELVERPDGAGVLSREIVRISSPAS